MPSDSVLAQRVRESSERELAQREEKATEARERQIRQGVIPAPEAGIERIEELTPEPDLAPPRTPAPTREPEPTEVVIVNPDPVPVVDSTT